MFFSLISGMIFGVLVSFGYRLTPLLSSQKIDLAFSPNTLHMGEIILAILAMLIKSVVHAIPGLGRAKTTGLKIIAPFELGAEDIARYHLAVSGNGSCQEMDIAQLMLFLSAVSEPAMLLLLASPWCPINPLGAVNVRNRLELLRPDLCYPESLKDMQSAYLTATVHSTARSVKRGVEWDLEVNINDLTAGDEETIFRQIFTMLEFGKAGKTQSSRISVAKSNERTDSQFVGQILLDKDTPLKWAALCKDYNFIHLSRMAAKLFGLPGQIAHGNHAVAKAIHLPREVLLDGPLAYEPTCMEVEFKKPMVIPGTFDVRMHFSEKTATKLDITRQGKVHATAKYGGFQ
jgi:acyl dehydratase